MSFPYWPNANGAYQQLNYISSTQALSIVPGGNTVYLNVGGGGSVGPNPSFSTITLEGANAITASLPSAPYDGFEVRNGGGGSNVVVITTIDSLNPTQAEMGIRKLDNGTGNALAQFEMVMNPTGNSGTLSYISSGITNGSIQFTESNAILINTGDGTKAGFYGGSFNTSSILVSSINNSAYPPVLPAIPSFSAVGLSNFSGGTAYIPGGNTAYPVSQDFTVVNGRTYRISQNFAMSNGDNTGTYTAFAVSGGGAGFPVFVTSVDNAYAVVALNGLSGGIQTQFKANATATAQVVAYNNSAVSTIVEAQPDGAGGGVGWLLEDMGVVL